jgi:hypothetical protein
MAGTSLAALHSWSQEVYLLLLMVLRMLLLLKVPARFCARLQRSTRV